MGDPPPPRSLTQSSYATLHLVNSAEERRQRRGNGEQDEQTGEQSPPNTKEIKGDKQFEKVKLERQPQRPPKHAGSHPKAVSKAAIGLTQLLPAALMLVLVANRTATFLAPMRFHGRVGTRGALLSMLAATGVSVLLALPRGVTSHIQSLFSPEQKLVVIFCYFNINNRYELLLYDSLVCSPPTIVLLLLVVLNSILLGCVLRARKLREQLTAGSDESVQGSGVPARPGARNEADGAVVVLAMSSTTLALNLPVSIVFWVLQLLGNPAMNNTAAIWIDILYLLKTLAMTNQAMNWAILLGCSSKMRQEVKGMFGF